MVLGSLGIFGGNEKTAAVPKQTQNNTNSSFSPMLDDALNGGAASSQSNAATGKSLAANDTISSDPTIPLIPGLPPITLPSSPTDPNTSTPLGSTPDPTAPASTDPPAIATLKAALVKAGMDISGMSFNEHQDLVTYPGGSYTNDLIDLQVGAHAHTYTTNLVTIDPHVTVVEIQQLLAGNRG